jgi:hypothetical protein
MTTAPLELSQTYSDRYASISHKLLRDAQRELDLGDLIQASEKAWGAAAHATKAVAEKWGWYHQGHYRLNAVVEYIAVERGRHDLVALYSDLALMHSNYYEHEYFEDRIQMAIDSTRVFVDEMELIRTEPVPVFPPAQTSTRPQQQRLRLLTTQPNDFTSKVSDISLLPPVESDAQETI